MECKLQFYCFGASFQFAFSYFTISKEISNIIHVLDILMELAL
jgi:hypothetical protein